MYCNNILTLPLRRGRAGVALQVVEDAPRGQERREALQYSRTVLLCEISRSPRLLYCTRPVLNRGYDRNERAQSRRKYCKRAS